MIKERNRLCGFLNAAMLVGVVLFLLLGLLRGLLRPKTINDYENRPAAQLPAFTLSGWLEGSFQEGVEKALGDQAPFSITMKRCYNDMENAIKYRAFSSISQRNPEQMVLYDGFRIYGGEQIAFEPRVLEDLKPQLDKRAENLNAVFAAHPDTDFYLYYIEKDTDIIFETGEKLGAYDYLAQRLSLPEERMACYAVDDLPSFRDRFYQTDHHWNWKGADLGYRQVAKLLGVEAPLQPEGEAKLISKQFSGSKVALLGTQNLFVEPFYAYQYPLPEMKVLVNGKEEGYGLQEEFFAGQASYLTYSSFHGGDKGEVIFDQGTGEKLLIIGESFDNAIVRLLASHFGRTHCVDLRYYEGDLGRPFRLGEYLQENDIDRVLLIGNVDYYVLDDFMLED